MLKELEEMFFLVRKTLLEERTKLLEQTSLNPKGEMSYTFDLKAEEIAITYSKENFGFPVKILSEERGEILTGEGTPKFTLVIDPVDGSTNFRRGIEISCFSVAAFPAEKPLAVQSVEFGLVGNIFTGSVWKGEKGKGCYFNGAKAESSKNVPGLQQNMPVKHCKRLACQNSKKISTKQTLNGFDRQNSCKRLVKQPFNFLFPFFGKKQKRPEHHKLLRSIKLFVQGKALFVNP